MWTDKRPQQSNLSCRLREGEKPSVSSASAVILSEDTQDELLLSMSGPVHR